MLGRIYFTGYDGYQNFLVFAQMFSSLILHSNRKVTNWLSTGIYSVLLQKSFSSLYSNFILSLYTVYELNTWPRNPTNNFTLKNCLFGTAKLVRNTLKNKLTYNGLGIAFDGEGSCSFGNGFASNVVIFGIDNSSSFHTDN